MPRRFKIVTKRPNYESNTCTNSNNCKLIARNNPRSRVEYQNFPFDRSKFPFFYISHRKEQLLKYIEADSQQIRIFFFEGIEFRLSNFCRNGRSASPIIDPAIRGGFIGKPGGPVTPYLANRTNEIGDLDGAIREERRGACIGNRYRSRTARVVTRIRNCRLDAHTHLHALYLA